MGKINIVRKGMQWKRKFAPKLDIHKIAHPVDQQLIGILEKFNLSEILNDPIEDMINANYAQMLATGIAVDEKNFPEVYKILKDTANLLGIKIPHTIITNGITGVNAFATGTDDNPFIAISNVTPVNLSINELTFIVAHECGHIAMEHMVYHSVGTLAADLGKLIPGVGPVVAQAAVFPLNYWNRCSEITADRIGLLCCGDLKTSQMALLKIVGGFNDISNIDIEQYILQAKRVLNMSALGKVGEYFASHPMIHKRLLALEYFANSESYFEVTGKIPPRGKKIYKTSELNEEISNIISVI